ncbi:MAG: hypothetical protein ABI923_10860 [bacterium]
MIRLIFAAVFSILVLGISISPVYGQRLNDNYFGTYPSNFEDQRLKAQLKEVNDNLRYGPDGLSNFDRRDPYASFDIPADLLARGEQLLKPTRAERATHAQFLKQPHVGLVRLLPDSKVVTIDQLDQGKSNKFRLAVGGAFYSFTRLNHSLWRADLKLKDGDLEVAFGPDVIGAVTTLGDVPIDSLTPDSPGVSTLATYAPPLERKQAQSEYEGFKAGLTLGGYTFQTQLPVRENTTYALRSIAYGQSDLLVAIRVVKQNSDGSVLLLWKRIGKFSTPKLSNKP